MPCRQLNPFNLWAMPSVRAQPQNIFSTSGVAEPRLTSGGEAAACMSNSQPAKPPRGTPATAGGTALFQVRKPSLVSQRYQRIDFRGASRGQVARAYADNRQTQRNHYERDFVIRRDSKQ